MDTVEIKQAEKKIVAVEAVLKGSTFNTVCIDGAQFNDISATNVLIVNANLSDLEIEGASLGGAYFHNIGPPPEGHPAYDPEAKQRPLRFEHCDLNGSNITNCNLSNVEIIGCDTTGMKINGILVDDLLRRFRD